MCPTINLCPFVCPFFCASAKLHSAFLSFLSHLVIILAYSYTKLLFPSTHVCKLASGSAEDVAVSVGGNLGTSGFGSVSILLPVNLTARHILQVHGVARVGGRNASKLMLFHLSLTHEGTTPPFLALKRFARHLAQTPCL